MKDKKDASSFFSVHRAALLTGKILLISESSENWIFIPPFHGNCALNPEHSLMTFSEMMKKRFTQPNTSSSPQQKERSQHFPNMMLRSGCYATSVVMSSRRVVCVCDKGVVFAFLLVRRPETGKRRKKNVFRGCTREKSDFSEESETILGSRRLHHARSLRLRLTQNTKFIRTTKNLTIEQHAFIVIFFRLLRLA